MDGIDGVNLGIQSEYRKIRTRNNSVFGHFSRSVCSFYTSFLLPYLFCNAEFELIRLIEFQKKANIEIIGF